MYHYAIPISYSLPAEKEKLAYNCKLKYLFLNFLCNLLLYRWFLNFPFDLLPSSRNQHIIGDFEHNATLMSLMPCWQIPDDVSLKFFAQIGLPIVVHISGFAFHVTLLWEIHFFFLQNKLTIVYISNSYDEKNTVNSQNYEMLLLMWKRCVRTKITLFIPHITKYGNTFCVW